LHRTVLVGRTAVEPKDAIVILFFLEGIEAFDAEIDDHAIFIKEALAGEVETATQPLKVAFLEKDIARFPAAA
jgi:hypothetical protein